ncbi:MAG TPA: hypothetical protein VIM86_00175 [Thermodesulfobacteriota bacterium]
MTRSRPPDVPAILPERSALEFFNERVTSALVNQRVDATDDARFYLVTLLNDRLNANRAGPGADRDLEDEPLALVLARALQASLSEQVALLKALGDRALYVSGVFSDSLARHVVDVDYYVSMGEMAYGKLAGVMKGGRRPSAYAELYDELASRFPVFVEVLNEVSEGLSLTSNSALLRLYERWLRTGSRRAAEKLSKEGIVPTPVPTKYLQ